jgi:hypothetical protein
LLEPGFIGNQAGIRYEFALGSCSPDQNRVLVDDPMAMGTRFLSVPLTGPTTFIGTMTGSTGLTGPLALADSLAEEIEERGDLPAGKTRWGLRTQLVSALSSVDSYVRSFLATPRAPAELFVISSDVVLGFCEDMNDAKQWVDTEVQHHLIGHYMRHRQVETVENRSGGMVVYSVSICERNPNMLFGQAVVVAEYTVWRVPRVEPLKT